MVTQEQMAWLYRCILGREGDPAGINAHVAAGMSFSEARHSLMDSPEFEGPFLARMLAEETIYSPEVTQAEKKPFVSLSCIVKNEAEHIGEMLASCADLISHASIVDTGSTDATREIITQVLAARGIPLTMAEIPFENFAQARNASLAGVSEEADWILVLDADERIVEEDHWRFQQLLQAGPAIEGWRLPRFHFLDREKTLPTLDYPDFQARLFRNKRESKASYAGRVHEHVINIARWGHAALYDPSGTGRGGPHIHHMGPITVNERGIRHEKEQWYISLAAE